jgi:hypothetical protein
MRATQSAGCRGEEEEELPPCLLLGLKGRALPLALPGLLQEQLLPLSEK